MASPQTKTQTGIDFQSEIIRLLRNSTLAEHLKKTLMVILPFLRTEELIPIYEGLSFEPSVKTEYITKEQFEQGKAEIEKIKKEAWKMAERNEAKKKEKLEDTLTEKLSETDND